MVASTCHIKLETSPCVSEEKFSVDTLQSIPSLDTLQNVLESSFQDEVLQWTLIISDNVFFFVKKLYQMFNF